MLRMLVVFLLLANGLYFAWAQGHLAVWKEALGLGAGPPRASQMQDRSAQYTALHPEAIEWVEASQAATAPPVATPVKPAPVAVPEPVAVPAARAPEPETIDLKADASTMQEAARADDGAERESVVPESVPQPPSPPVVEPPKPVVAALAPVAPPAVPAPSVPKQCMAIGPFSAEQMEPIRPALQSMGRNQWRIEGSAVSGRWMVFWGGANDELVLSARRGELQNKAIPFERLRTSPVGIGFSLGRFSSEAAAQQHKKDVERKGVRGTTVQVERAPSMVYTIEFPDYGPIKDVLRRDFSRYFGARSWQPC